MTEHDMIRAIYELYVEATEPGIAQYGQIDAFKIRDVLGAGNAAAIIAAPYAEDQFAGMSPLQCYMAGYENGKAFERNMTEQFGNRP